MMSLSQDNSRQTLLACADEDGSACMQMHACTGERRSEKEEAETGGRRQEGGDRRRREGGGDTRHTRQPLSVLPLIELTSLGLRFLLKNLTTSEEKERKE